eukprot:gnl/Chilomastix_cuspidata/1690.p1 GENE.gnl/Chilomastix_cuspidata/1690~~gnl/Chilomastix_cuspidata/1690.p1  ORF type:complete len:423 (+),score=134.61 gnl/Chilomastix_cuspidata/1690:1482-2750(+)
MDGLSLRDLVWSLSGEDQDARESAVDRLYDTMVKYLEKETFSYLQMMQIWKGIYYCLWNTDKMEPQQEIIKKIVSVAFRLAKHELDDRGNVKRSAAPAASEEEPASSDTAAPTATVPALALLQRFSPSPTCIAYVRCGFLTLAREFPRIDPYRLDKMYSLLRALVSTCMRIDAEWGWGRGRLPLAAGAAAPTSNDASDLIVETFALIVLRPSALVRAVVPQSVATFIADVFLDELNQAACDSDAANSARPGEIPPFAFSELIVPWVSLVAGLPARQFHPLVSRVQERVFARIVSPSSSFRRSLLPDSRVTAAAPGAYPFETQPSLRQMTLLAAAMEGSKNKPVLRRFGKKLLAVKRATGIAVEEDYLDAGSKDAADTTEAKDAKDTASKEKPHAPRPRKNPTADRRRRRRRAREGGGAKKPE